MKIQHWILTGIALTSVSGGLSANPNDLDKDKRISWEEFVTLKQKDAKRNGRPFHEKEIRYLFEDKDLDGNGTLSYKELASHPVDINEDKSISYEEFVNMLRKRSKRNGTTPKEEWMRKLFEKRDANGNGSLSYEELAKPVE